MLSYPRTQRRTESTRVPLMMIILNKALVNVNEWTARGVYSLKRYAPTYTRELDLGYQPHGHIMYVLYITFQTRTQGTCLDTKFYWYGMPINPTIDVSALCMHARIS